MWLREASFHSLIYAAGAAIQGLLNFALLPLYTKHLTPEDFGVFRIAALAASLAGAVFYLGAYSSLSRFYFDSDEGKGRRLSAGTAAVLTIIGGSLQMAVVLLLAVPVSVVILRSSTYAPHLIIAFLASALTFINQIFLLMLRLQRRSVTVIALNTGALLATVIAAVALVVIWPLGAIGALAAGAIGQVIVMPFVVGHAWNAFDWRLPREEFLKQLRFGAPAVAIGLGYYALDSVGRLMFARMGTLTDLGILTFGYTIGFVVQTLFVQSFTQIWNPMRLEHRDHPDSGRLSALVSTYYALAGSALLAGMSLFAPEIVAILGRRPEYTEASRIVPIILSAQLLYGAINFIDTGILVRNRLRYHVAIYWSVFILNVAMNYVLIPRYGYLGSAWAMLASYLLLISVAYVVSNQLLTIHLEPRRLALITATVGLAIWVGTLLQGLGLASIISRFAVFATLLGTWYLIVLTDDERAWLTRRLGHQPSPPA